MQLMGAFEAKTHFSALLERVENGEEVVITKRGHAVARMVPISQYNNERCQQAIQELIKFSKQNKLGNLNWKMLRDQGRR